jgi:hypothetical protein
MHSDHRLSRNGRPHCETDIALVERQRFGSILKEKAQDQHSRFRGVGCFVASELDLVGVGRAELHVISIAGLHKLHVKAEQVVVCSREPGVVPRSLGTQAEHVSC